MSYYDDLKKVPADMVDIYNSKQDMQQGKAIDRVEESVAGLADKALGTDVIKPVVQTINAVEQLQRVNRLQGNMSKLVRHLVP